MGHTFFNTKIKVPYIFGDTAVVTISTPVDKQVFVSPLCAEDKDLKVFAGNDLKCTATVEVGTRVFRGFTIIENMFTRGHFKEGNVFIGEPTQPDGKGSWKPKYSRYRYTDNLGMAVRIAYMAAKGIHPNLVRYAQEDRYGQMCSQCNDLGRPYSGNPDMVCRLHMFDAIDMSEVQKTRYDVIDKSNGKEPKFFQAFSTWIKDFNDTAKPWFRDIEALDNFFTSVSMGLSDDLGYEGMMQVYPHFSPETMIDEEGSLDEETVNRDAVLSLLEMHDRTHNLGGLLIRMAFDQALTREDMERFPKTVMMFEDNHIAEEKGYTMQFLSNNALDAYGVDGTCAYGTNDVHKNGFKTEQVLIAQEIRAQLLELADPIIVTAHIRKVSDYTGFEVIDVRQALLAPSAEVSALPNVEFIAAYVNELRAKFPAIKESLAEVLKNDHILVVGHDDSPRVRGGAGFDIVDGKIIVDAGMDIHARHVFAWVLSKLTKKHDLGVHNA